MQSLKKIFHSNSGEHYRKEYELRFTDKETIHLNLNIGEEPAFFCQTVEIYKILLSIEKTDKQVEILFKMLPGVALNQFKHRCLIDEIVLTNNIEGVYSTRKEISSILSNLAKQDPRRRFTGLVKKYVMMSDDITIKTPEDIRRIYDDIFYEEIKETDPDNLPDGKIFRTNPVSVYSAAQKEIHRGIYPEERIISTMSSALDFLNDESVNMILRIAVFHYLFGYIHPFYDGNGRTSRFISSRLLAKELNELISYRLSYTIKENTTQYYDAFKTCNSPLNKGDLTPFVEMFLTIVDISEKQLYNALKMRIERWHYLLREIKSKGLVLNSNNVLDQNLARIYDLLVQAALFSDDGISTKELEENTDLAYNTLMKHLKKIPKDLIIKKKPGNTCYYKLDLDVLEKSNYS